MNQNYDFQTCSLETFCLLFQVEKLQAHWEDSHTKLTDRALQLQNMYKDSSDWLEARKRVELLIKKANEKLESWKKVDDLKGQNADVKVMQKEHNIYFMTQDKLCHETSQCACVP